jgi:hypothetical protein
MLSGLAENEQWRGAGIVFDLAHGVADSGDDVAASPVMKLVLTFWLNHYVGLRARRSCERQTAARILIAALS